LRFFSLFGTDGKNFSKARTNFFNNNCRIGVYFGGRGQKSADGSGTAKKKTEPHPMRGYRVEGFMKNFG